MEHLSGKVGTSLALLVLGLGRCTTSANGQTNYPNRFIGPANRREAISVLQGTDTLAWLDPRRVVAVTRAIALIRARFPELRDIHHSPDNSWLEVRPDQDRFVPSRVHYETPPMPCRLLCERKLLSTGIPGLDSIVHAWGAAVTAYGDSSDIATFYVYPPRPIDVWNLADTLLPLAGIASAGPVGWAGDGSRITLIPKGDTDLYVFARGGGDCPAGCTSWDFYYVRHDLRTNRLALIATRLNNAQEPWPDVPLWDTPFNGSFRQYHALRDLTVAAHDSLWWLRLHAVRALRHIVSHAQGRNRYWEQDPAEFRQLQDAAFGAWHATLGIPFHRLTDPDPQVRFSALHLLRELARKPYPAAGTDTVGWRRWIAAQPSQHPPFPLPPGD